jgi:hypothetical protein
MVGIVIEALSVVVVGLWLTGVYWLGVALSLSRSP